MRSYGAAGDAEEEASQLIRPEDAAAVNQQRLGRLRRALSSGVFLALALVIFGYTAERSARRGRRASQHAAALPESSFEARADGGGGDAVALSSYAGSMPHIVFVTLDDVGYNDFGPDSSDLSKLTPSLTHLMNDGVRLTNYYGQSHCTPARAAIQTGMFVHRLGFTSHEVGHEINALSNYSVSISRKLLGEYMGDGGYSTAFIGKWNIGHCNTKYAPWNRGYDYFMGYFSSGVNYVKYTPNVNTYFMVDDVKHDLRDMLEANSTTGLIRTGSSWQDWRTDTNYTDAVFSSVASNHIQEHVATYSASAGSGSTPLFMQLAFHGPHDDYGAALDDVLIASAASYSDGGHEALEALAKLEKKAEREEYLPRYKFGRSLMAADGAFNEVSVRFTRTRQICTHASSVLAALT